MRSCEYCAQPLRDGAKYCTACGKPVAAIQAPPLKSIPPVVSEETSAATAGEAASEVPRHWLASRRAKILAACAAVVLVGGIGTTAVAMTLNGNAKLPSLASSGSTTTGVPPRVITSPTAVVTETAAVPTELAPTQPAQQPTQPSQPAPVTDNDVVSRYYSAVTAHQWAVAWQLGGGQNLGMSYTDFVNGYAHTTGQVLTIDAMDGTDTQVPVHLLAYTDAGMVQLFSGVYTVQGGVIVQGQLTEQFTEPAGTFQAVGMKTKLADLGYVPDTTLPPGTATSLVAVTATCTNSGDGHCQKVFFFYNNTLVGVDTAQADTAVNVSWVAGNNAALVYPQYNTGDALCCPSGNAVTGNYSLIGSGKPEAGCQT